MRYGLFFSGWNNIGDNLSGFIFNFFTFVALGEKELFCVFYFCLTVFLGLFQQNRIVMSKILCFLLVMFSTCLLAQDIIVKINGEELSSKIIEIGVSDIKYKRFENLDGSTYIITKAEVFMIKYDNGTKDVFRKEVVVEKKVERKENDRLARENLIIGDSKEFNFKSVNNSSRDVLNDYQFDLKKVFSEHIYYFGIDLSVTQMIESSGLGTVDLSMKYISGWEFRFHRELTPEKVLARWFGKERFQSDIWYSQKRNMLKEKDWVTTKFEALTLLQIQSIVLDYKENTKFETGVGFVFIVDGLDKSTETVSGYHTFFDLQTGELLWVSNVQAKGSGPGQGIFWASGMIDSMKNYIDDVYKPLKKDFLK